MIPIQSILISAGVALSLAASSFAGYQAASWGCKAKEQDFLGKLQHAEAKRDKKSYDAGLDFQKDKTNEQVIHSQIEKIVERVVQVDHYRGSCLDDAGLRVVNAAISGRVSSKGSVEPLPRPESSDGRKP